MSLEAVELKDGMDSGAVPEKTKLQVFVNGLGRCSAPNCSARLLQDRTKIGECAHIIPKVVGSHPREDYKTSLEDRKKEANLLYLCERHHKPADDKVHATIYTAELLREWKKEHEDWAARTEKNSVSFPKHLQEMLAGIAKEVSQQSHELKIIINKLLLTCRELLQRQLLNEAKIFLAQIDTLLVDANDSELNAKTDLLNAILSVRTEQIPAAKEQLLKIIKSYPHDVEAMLEYVEVCDSAPETSDEALKIEKLARDLSKDHPRLLLIDLGRRYRELKPIEDPQILKTKIDDVRLNARLICQHSLFCDFAKDNKKRDELINLWESELPTSPRPNLFKVLYATLDIVRSPENIKDPIKILSTINLSKQQREKVLLKDPLARRDKITWLMQEMRLELSYMRSSGVNRDLKELKEIHENLLPLIYECYFDNFSNDVLPEFLTSLHVEADQWRKIALKIQESQVLPSNKTIESLFLQGLQHEELTDDLLEFVKKFNADDLLIILQAIQDKDAQKIAEISNLKNDPFFSLMLIQSIRDHEVILPLTELLKVNEEHKEDLTFARLKALSLNNKVDEAVALIPTLSINEATPFALQTIERIASTNQQWHLFIPLALKLLDFDIPLNYRIHLEGGLALAYFYQGDDTGVADHAEKALKNLNELGADNSRRILYALCKSLAMKGLVNEACEKFQQYANIERDFALLLEEADFYFKSTLSNKDEKALSIIIRAFEETKTHDEKLYIAAFLPLIELQKVGLIPVENEPQVKDGVFIKLDGFFDGWFYVGEEKKFDVKNIAPNTPEYKAIIHKTKLEEVEWPADRFTNPNLRCKILHILTPSAFLCVRSHQAMENQAKLGTGLVWSIRMLKEDGSIDKENIRNFFEETFRQNNEFFTTYSTSVIPFSFLCKIEGGLAKAVGKISAEQKGFIHCNNGTPADLEAQKITANEALNGKRCFIDGLSAVLLAEAKLLEVVVANMPNLGVSTSVIRLLRKMADDLLFSGDGKLVFARNDFIAHGRNKGKEETLRNKLLSAADLLDSLPNKVVGKVYPKAKEDKNLDSVLPDYFVDTFRFSQEKDAHALTDDPLLITAYGLSGEQSLPKYFSSFSLVRTMADSGKIDWESYLKYFALLSGYRYRFLPISVDDMMQSVFPKTAGGLVGFAPKNISFLNLSLTLSKDYGVEDKVAVNVLSSFFTKLIEDSSVLPEMSEEIFAITIVRSLANKDKKIMAKAIFQVCSQAMLNKPWITQNSHKKLEILLVQLSKFCQSFDPVVMEIPSLLKSGLK